jgi:ABC-type uncharacterized transport system permease subunit
MDQDSRPPTDLRQQRRQTERRLAVAVVLSLVLLGGGLVGLIYGRGAAILAVSCLSAGCAVFGALWLILTGMEWWATRE